MFFRGIPFRAFFDLKNDIQLTINRFMVTHKMNKTIFLMQDLSLFSKTKSKQFSWQISCVIGN